MDIARMFFRFLFPLVTLFFANHASAEIYKCPQLDGTVKFSDRICADGKDEAIVLFENSPLDNTAERENIARYNQQQRSQRKSARQKPQMVLIEDTPTVERNARITAQERTKKKRKNKTKKRSKQAAAKNKKAAAKNK
jgi:hypothetical protein